MRIYEEDYQTEKVLNFWMATIEVDFGRSLTSTRMYFFQDAWRNDQSTTFEPVKVRKSAEPKFREELTWDTNANLTVG